MLKLTTEQSGSVRPGYLVTFDLRPSTHSNDLARVQQVVRVEQRLHPAHPVQGRAVFRGHIRPLGQPDPVFAGRRAPQCQGMDQLLAKGVRPVVLIGGHRHERVEVAVTDMPQDAPLQAQLAEQLLGVGNALGQASQRHRRVGDQVDCPGCMLTSAQ